MLLPHDCPIIIEEVSARDGFEEVATFAFRVAAN